MKTILRYIRLYFLITSQYIKARLSYRADFFISGFGILLANIPAFFGMVIVLKSIPNLAGWSFDELVFIYGFTLLSMSPLQIVFDNVWNLRMQVQTGNFVKFYFRPLNMLFYYMSEIVDIKGFFQLALSIGLLAWSSVRIGIVWTLPRILGALCMLVGGSTVMVGLMIAASSTAFWIVNSFSLLALINRFRDYARYPLSIFNGVFRFLFTAVIPIGFIAFYPVEWIIHPEAAGRAPYFTPLAGIVSFCLGYLVWVRGTRRWSGTGS